MCLLGFVRTIQRYSTESCSLKRLTPLKGKGGVEQLTRRGLVVVQGTDSHEFLQGLITNDISLTDSTGDNKGNPLYSFLLNNRGRVLYDVIITAEEPHSYVIDCDLKIRDKLVTHLNRYKLRKKVIISKDEGRSVWAVFGEGVGLGDPREVNMPFRVISPEAPGLNNEVTRYDMTRYMLGIAEGADEVPSGDALPLEYNGDLLNGISFNKGCYIGQELTARVHHTGVIRKRILPLELMGLSNRSVSFDKDTQILDPNVGKPIGKLRGYVFDGQNGKCYGIGLMRVKESLTATSLVLDSIKCPELTTVKILTPPWLSQLDITNTELRVSP